LKFERKKTLFCPNCALEFQGNKIFRLTEEGERVEVFVDSRQLELIDTTTLIVKLANGKTERLTSVIRVGNVGGWMVIEFADGHQKLYSPYNIISVEEKVSEKVQEVGIKEKAAS